MANREPLFDQVDSIPLVERARTELLHAILEHRFEEKLPPENELASMLNVSRTTVRAALQGLEQDGLIVRRRSVGTRINRQLDIASMALQRMVGFDWLLREQGYEVSTETELTLARCDRDMVEVFDLDSRSEYLCSAKRYLAGGTLAIFVRDIIPLGNVVPTAVDDLDALVAAGPDLFEVSSRYLIQPIQAVRAQIVPMVKSNKSVTELELSRHEPFVRLHERHLSVDGDEIAYSVVDVVDSYVRFEVYRRR